MTALASILLCVAGWIWSLQLQDQWARVWLHGVIPDTVTKFRFGPLNDAKVLAIQAWSSGAFGVLGAGIVLLFVSRLGARSLSLRIPRWLSACVLASALSLVFFECQTAVHSRGRVKAEIHILSEQSQKSIAAHAKALGHKNGGPISEINMTSVHSRDFGSVAVIAGAIGVCLIMISTGTLRTRLGDADPR